MIYRIAECQDDYTKQFTEYGDVVPSDEGEDKW